MRIASMTVFAIVVASCQTPAEQVGVGRACTSDVICSEGETCLPFEGGYCGRRGCDDDADCPAGSACVAHDDGVTYCFLECRSDNACNVERVEERKVACEEDVAFVEEQEEGTWACVPPAAGE